MSTNHIKIIKNDVTVATNGDCVDISVTPFDQKGKNARISTLTLNQSTAVNLRDALNVYLMMDSPK